MAHSPEPVDRGDPMVAGLRVILGLATPER